MDNMLLLHITFGKLYLLTRPNMMEEHPLSVTGSNWTFSLMAKPLTRHKYMAYMFHTLCVTLDHTKTAPKIMQKSYFVPGVDTTVIDS